MQTHKDKTASYGSLANCNIFSETEGFIVVINDQVICTKNCRNQVIKELRTIY